MNVSIRACPLGFEKTGDHCSRDHRLLEAFKTLICFIGNVSITIKDNGWFGYDKMSVVMGSYPHVQCDINRGGTFVVLVSLITVLCWAVGNVKTVLDCLVMPLSG